MIKFNLLLIVLAALFFNLSFAEDFEEDIMWTPPLSSSLHFKPHEHNSSTVFLIDNFTSNNNDGYVEIIKKSLRFCDDIVVVALASGKECSSLIFALEKMPGVKFVAIKNKQHFEEFLTTTSCNFVLEGLYDAPQTEEEVGLLLARANHLHQNFCIYYYLLMTNSVLENFPENKKARYRTCLSSYFHHSLPNIKISHENWEDVKKLYRETLPQIDINHKKAFFAGSFDPLTNGHLGVIKRASKLFDTVTIGVGINSRKNYMFDMAAKTSFIKDSLEAMNFSNCSTKAYSNLTATQCLKEHTGTLIRSIRSLNDFNDEIPLAWVNKQQVPLLETVLAVPPEDSSISSSAVRQYIKANEDISQYVPGTVLWDIQQRRLAPIIKKTKIIGLIGGIAAGKTTVLDMMKSLSNDKIAVIDLDKQVRQLYSQRDVINEVTKTFGSEICHKGKIDRKKLGNIVFHDNKKLDKLQRILMPRLFKDIEQLLLKHIRNNTPLIFIEGITIIERGIYKICDKIWYIEASPEIRLQRVQQRDNRSNEQIIAINKIQTPLLITAKTKADTIIANEKDLTDLYNQINDALQSIR